jgi:hypothetical protein
MATSTETRTVELVTFDPADADTYPSVCPTAEDVERRFGYVGGETLLFDEHGSYLGQLVKRIGEPS